LYLTLYPVLSTETNEWQRLQCTGHLPPARCAHSACVVGDLMLVYGGTCQTGQTTRHEHGVLMTVQATTQRRSSASCMSWS
jgi:hypothetical protein